jgi:uroporphyrinogen-III synthase
MRLIVTRPEPDAVRTAEALARLGHQPILSPMLDIVLDAKAAIPDREFQAVLATSTNAVRALAAHSDRGRLRDRPLFAVGDHTALQAKRAGFAAARSAGGAVDDLVARVAAEFSPAAGPLLYAAGDVLAGDLAGKIRELGFDVDVAVVYRAKSRVRLAVAAAAALRRDEAEGILLYSRRGAEAFAKALRLEGLAPLARGVACFCLSAAVAEPLPAVARGRIVIAERPDQLSLFASVEREAALNAGDGA